MNKLILASIGALIVFDVVVIAHFVKKERVFNRESAILTGERVYDNRILLGNDGRPFSGVYQEYFEDGSLYREISYRKGIMHGPWRRYYANGTLEYEFIAQNGDRHVRGKMYHKNGKIQGIVEKVNGVPMIKRYDALGNFIIEQKFGL